MLNQILRPVARCAFTRGTRSYNKAQFNHPTLDDICHPEGSWKEHNAKRQKKYNTVLAIGIAGASLTYAAILKFELINFNYLPPKLDE